MQQMARTWPERFAQQAVAQLPWGHVVTLMSGCKTRPELDFYAQHAVRNGWSRDDPTSAIHHALHLSHAAAINNKESDGPTIGILIAESRDRSMVEYALRGHNQPPAPTPVCPTACASCCPAPKISPVSPTAY
ncbi:DUF1016 N-terminal domain-containing protein [Streptomyces sp. NPDC048295]|uniref:DUF1016 N-terminal domain-containing protein n=1 Tax=Streptomyces sp. NPDC048295 TaxID=3154617 RepID=UPI00343BA5BA